MTENETETETEIEIEKDIGRGITRGIGIEIEMVVVVEEEEITCIQYQNHHDVHQLLIRSLLHHGVVAVRQDLCHNKIMKIGREDLYRDIITIIIGAFLLVIVWNIIDDQRVLVPVLVSHVNRRI